MSIEKIAKKIKNRKLPEIKELLVIADENGWAVAHALTYYHPTWITNDLEILSLVSVYGETVENVLKRRRKI